MALPLFAFHGPIYSAVSASPIGASGLQPPLGKGVAQPFYFSFKGSSSSRCLLVSFSHVSQALFHLGFLLSQGLHPLRVGGPLDSGAGALALEALVFPLSLMAFKGGQHLLHQLKSPRWGSWQPLLFVDFSVKGEDFFLGGFGADRLDSADKSTSGSSLGRPSLCSLGRLFTQLLSAPHWWHALTFHTSWPNGKGCLSHIWLAPQGTT